MCLRVIARAGNPDIGAQAAASEEWTKLGNVVCAAGCLAAIGQAEEEVKLSALTDLAASEWDHLCEDIGASAATGKWFRGKVNKNKVHQYTTALACTLAEVNNIGATNDVSFCWPL